MKNKLPEKKGRVIHIKLSEDIHKRLRICVAELDTTIQHWVADLIENELNKQNKKR